METILKIYEAKDDEEIVDALINLIEKDTGKEIFTMKILDQTEEGLLALIVFTDKNIVNGLIKIQSINGKMAIRLQGNYIN